MTGPFEKPTDIRFYSKPALGTKIVKMDDNGSSAYLKALWLLGVKAHRTPTGDGIYTITIDDLGALK